ncbi:MAG: helix-turn-helix domain-containing protein [Clostridia bacterium]|nr:helix-turn-helix domain-containing protein [Clostridia bacterium]
MSYYEDLRNAKGWSRREVCDQVYKLLGFYAINESKLRRIEEGEGQVKADDVLILSKVYGEPALKNYYCTNECKIGKESVPEIKIKDLTQIVLEMLSSLNTLEQRQARFIEITADGEIQDSEIEDFIKLQHELEKMEVTIETMQYWIEKMLNEGKINKLRYDSIRTRLGI